MKERTIWTILLILIIVSLVLIVSQQIDFNNLNIINVTVTNNSISTPTSNIQPIDKELNEDIILPSYFEKPVEIIFGIKGKVSLSLFVIMACVFIGLLMLIHSLIQFLPFFSGEIKSIIATIIITLLIGISGGLREAAAFIIWLVDLFSIIRKSSILGFIFSLFLAIFIIWGFLYIINIIKKKTEKDENENNAVKAAVGVEQLKIQAKSLEGLAKK